MISERVQPWFLRIFDSNQTCIFKDFLWGSQTRTFELNWEITKVDFSGFLQKSKIYFFRIITIFGFWQQLKYPFFKFFWSIKDFQVFWENPKVNSGFLAGPNLRSFRVFGWSQTLGFSDKLEKSIVNLYAFLGEPRGGFFRFFFALPKWWYYIKIFGKTHTYVLNAQIFVRIQTWIIIRILRKIQTWIFLRKIKH